MIAGIKNVLYAKVLRSPYPHARIISLDTSKAEALPGVHCVLTYDDPEVAALPTTCCAWTSVNTASLRPDVLPEPQGPARPRPRSAGWATRPAWWWPPRPRRSPKRPCASSRSSGRSCRSCSTRTTRVSPSAPVIHPEIKPDRQPAPRATSSAAGTSSSTRATLGRYGRGRRGGRGHLASTTAPTTAPRHARLPGPLGGRQAHLLDQLLRRPTRPACTSPQMPGLPLHEVRVI